MTDSKLQPLTPAQELAFLREIHGPNSDEKLFAFLMDSFNVLHNRSQMLLSLITICLTITGFSGPTIAASSGFSRLAIVFGLVFVLASALVLLTGPLDLRWVTRHSSGDIDQTLVVLLQRRNTRTTRFHIASACLVIGLAGYVFSVVGFLLSFQN